MLKVLLYGDGCSMYCRRSSILSLKTSILKNMKYNKSPGIDGISAEFLKVFWGQLIFLCGML